MRVIPINVLKVLVDRRATLYKKAPRRTCQNPQDQVLVDFYTQELHINSLFQKANRYYHLQSNLTIYPVMRDGYFEFEVVPPYLYSVKTSKINPREADAFIFNAFTDDVLGSLVEQAATGQEGFQRGRGYKFPKDQVNSNEKQAYERNREYIFWSDFEHFTTDSEGNKLILNPELGAEQWINPLSINPIVTIAKDRDDEYWASQGEDAVDIALALQKAWSDVFTIAKHAGFPILTIVSENKPENMTLGLNKAVWLKQQPDGPTPTISYVEASTRINEHLSLINRLQEMFFITQGISPKHMGTDSAQASSGFQVLLEMSDLLELREMDKPVFQTAEQEFWYVLKTIHNFYFDGNLLTPEVRRLGRFSDDFTIDIQFSDVKPIESEREVIENIQKLQDMGLITRREALRRIHPDMSDEMIDDLMAQIDLEAQARVERARVMFQPQDTQTEEPVDGEEG
jgi:hypothetical protein